jgi:thiamine biosynthesis lipoprotein
MGTTFRLVLYARNRDSAVTASRAAFGRIARLDATMSDYDETSELSSLCRQSGSGPIRISEDLFRVLAEAQHLAERTGGAFDVTVGPVSRLWRRARRSGELPDAERLTKARRLVDFRSLHLDPHRRTAFLEKRGMLLDLGGIGKGFAADEALAVLRNHGIDVAMVAAGGDIAVGKPPPGSSGWRIGVAAPNSTKRLRQTLVLSNSAVSTSGDAEQHVEIAGTRYSHIIDPRSGVPAPGRSTVTVVAPTCMLSDALATAVSVLGPDRGLELIDSTAGASATVALVAGENVRAYRSKRWFDGH